MKPFQAGDLIFVRGHGPLSMLIKLFDGEFSHVAIALSDQVILESQFIVNVQVAQMTYEDIEIIDLGLSDADRDVIVHQGINMVGKYYDYGQLIWQGAMDLFRLKGHNLLNRPNQLICSEVLVNLLLSIDWFKSPKEIKYIEDTTPNELYAIIKNQLEKRF